MPRSGYLVAAALAVTLVAGIGTGYIWAAGRIVEVRALVMCQVPGLRT